MRTTWSQLKGIIQYEFRMHWRRRALVVIMLSMILLIGVSSLIGGDNLSDLIANSNHSDEDINKAYTLTAMLATWVPIATILAFILPVTLADTIPLDQHYGISDLLKTVSISPSNYLIGKLFGAWLAVIIGMIPVGIISTILWIIAGDSLDIGLFIQTGIIVCLSLTILNGGLGVLLAIGQPNRRRAFITVAIIFIALIITFITIDNHILELANPMRLDLITYFVPLDIADGEPLSDVVITGDVWLTIIFGVIELIMIGGLGWIWLRRQEISL